MRLLAMSYWSSFSKYNQKRISSAQIQLKSHKANHPFPQPATKSPAIFQKPNNLRGCENGDAITNIDIEK